MQVKNNSRPKLPFQTYSVAPEGEHRFPPQVVVWKTALKSSAEKFN